LRCFIRSEANGDKNNNGGLHNDEQKNKGDGAAAHPTCAGKRCAARTAAAAGVEIENVKSELAKTVGERDRFRNELNGAQLDLSNAKRRLDDFRLRQEAIVNALTEAHNTRERILKEANANADRIDAEAKQRRTDILNKAQAALESAKKEAAQADCGCKRDAAGIRDAAQKDAQQVTDTALDEATELIAGAKADAETMMDEAQAAVDEKQAQVDELNFSLSEKARLALEQARKYAQIMESLAELNFETAVEARYAEKYDTRCGRAREQR